MVRGLVTGPQVLAVIAEVAREYQQQEALLAAWAPLPDTEILNTKYLEHVHCHVWHYPTHHHLHPIAWMVPPSYGPAGPTH